MRGRGLGRDGWVAVACAGEGMGMDEGAPRWQELCARIKDTVRQRTADTKRNVIVHNIIRGR
jgi:hypothetical protein